MSDSSIPIPNPAPGTPSPAPKRNLAVGHFYNEPFIEVCAPWVNRISEVFFAWPGILSCRPAPEDSPALRAKLFRELHWCRDNGILLDTLFNCNCYGDTAVGSQMADTVISTLDAMGGQNLFPDIVTTTSPFIAEILRQEFPQVRIRASVNMRIHGTIGFEAVTDLFDEFYLSREHHRSLDYVRRVSEWAKLHGKKIGMQLNSGCLRECPFQTFHDNLHGHNRINQSREGQKYHFDIFRCRTRYAVRHAYEDFLRATWIRPEDSPLWEPYIDVFKLATRRVNAPSQIVNAYASYHFDGNLLTLMDPDHSASFAPYIIDNQSFPPDWMRDVSGTAVDCASNCTHCGRCTAILEKVMVKK